jgi:glycosyltransferase involved in cell wall biosynthesis
MKILMATPQWLETKGGPTNYVFNLKRNLENLGQKVIIAAPDAKQFGDSSESRFKTIYRIFILLIKHQPDVIHIHGRLNYIVPAIVYKYLLRRLNLNIIFTFHTQPVWKGYLDNHIEPKKSYGLFNGSLGSLLLKFCNHRVSVSESIIKNINKHTHLRVLDCKVVPSGANEFIMDTEESENLRLQYNLTTDNLVISTIGVFSWDWKVAGHKLLLETLNNVKLRYPEVKLLIVGDGRYGGLLRDMVRNLNLDDNVIFLGYVESTAGVLSISDLYVHTGLNEGFPLSIVEAMIQGRAIIAVDQGGIPEVIFDGVTGLLTGIDSKELADAILKLAENRELAKELGGNAKKVALAELTWNNITTSYMKLYEG